ncbi:penicillin-binding protein 1A [Bacterioplanoides pacificum]|uniref:Penicillin-binding protein 1A n=1 Tax=Bacterioplanoides pacificum TaxID=1171596 RepID=A0ABV7VSP0_9GAMM
MVSLGIYLYLAPSLPDAEQLKDVDLQTPLRVYTEDGLLISEFGEKRRSPISFDEVPQQFIDALLASEDDAYFQHIGVDFKGLARAALELIRTGRKKSGGSTITMQVAKNYYLSSEKTFKRKFTEILLALKIEKALSKQEILELYVNKIYLGKRAYGIQAAARVYYGKTIDQLTLAQLAMIAGLPQAPSAANPINSPERAIERRNYVLARMRTLDKITDEQFQTAAREPISARYHGPTSEVSAPYVAEMVRRDMIERFGSEAYTAGYKVFTTVDAARQQAANLALQRGLLSYDRDHGWRTTNDNRSVIPSEPLSLAHQDPVLQEWLAKADPQQDIDWPQTLEQWRSTLNRRPDNGVLKPAMVTAVHNNGAWILLKDSEYWLPFSRIEWAKRYVNVNVIGDPIKAAGDVLSRGQEIWVEQLGDGYRLAQFPEVEGSLVSLRPRDGAIQALIGGFSASSNEFNRAIQADRQPGSSFKPFIYSAALANGFTPASIINDAPVVFEDASLESTWRPQNNSGKFYGPTRLRQALYKSQNLVSIRILKQMGAGKAINFIEPFGFPREKLSRDLSLALGASAVTPMELATGYAVLANGGYAVKPYLIQRIEDDNNNVLYQANPAIACSDCDRNDNNDNNNDLDAQQALEQQLRDSLGLTNEEQPAEQPKTPLAPQVMDSRTHFLMMSMLQDVVKRGTGRRALVLKRNDLAGKTGTTNDQKDGWFSGFSPDLVTTVWVGFDQHVTLGRWAYGSNTALPIWVDYMKEALKDVPQRPYQQPEGVVSVRIDAETGLLAAPGQSNAIFEYFREENVPQQPVKSAPAFGDDSPDSDAELIPEQMF